MSSLPTWAVWGVFVPLVLLSPVIALILAVVIESQISALADAGAPGMMVFGDADAGSASPHK